MEITYPNGGIIIPEYFEGQKFSFENRSTLEQGNYIEIIRDKNAIDKEIVEYCSSDDNKIMGLVNCYDAVEGEYCSLYFGDKESMLVSRKPNDLLAHRETKRAYNIYDYDWVFNIYHNRSIDRQVYPLREFDKSVLSWHDVCRDHIPVDGIEMYSNLPTSLRVIKLDFCRRNLQPIADRFTVMAGCLIEKDNPDTYHVVTSIHVHTER